MSRLKRLIKKCESENAQNIDTIDRIRQEVMYEQKNKNSTNMIMLSELDEADLRHEICPSCKDRPLKKKDGFFVCKRCYNVYKMLDGKGYMILE